MKMGMYSNFQCEDWAKINEKAILHRIEEERQLKKSKKVKPGHPSHYSEYWIALGDFYDANKNISFEAFDGWKIQGYWYAEWCKFLVEIAQWIEEGRIEFRYEEGQPFIIEFEEGEVTVDAASLEWERYEYKWLVQQAKLTKQEKVLMKL